MRYSRVSIAILVSVVIRYPIVLFFHSAFFLQGKKFLAEWKSLCSWDCPNYVELSANLEPSAFFPGLSLFAKIPQLLSVSPLASVLAVSLFFTILSGVLSLYFADAWADRFHKEGKPTSAKIHGFSLFAWVFFILVAFFPHSQFWMRGYSEPLFFAFALAWGYFRLKGHPRWALLPLALLPLTRPQGIWIWGLIILFDCIRDAKPKASAVFLRLMGFIPAAIPFAAFLIWNFVQKKSAFYFLEIQVKGWHRGFDWRRGIDAHLPRFLDASLFLYLGLAAGTYFFFKRRQSRAYLFLALGTWIFAEFPLWFGGLYSYNRFASIHVGMFLFLAEFLVNRRTWLALWVLWSFSRLASLTYRTGFGQWVESQGTPEAELDWLKPADQKLSYLLSPEVLKRAEEERKKTLNEGLPH